jgi:hypothetical protein
MVHPVHPDARPPRFLDIARPRLATSVSHPTQDGSGGERWRDLWSR